MNIVVIYSVYVEVFMGFEIYTITTYCVSLTVVNAVTVRKYIDRRVILILVLLSYISILLNLFFSFKEIYLSASEVNEIIIIIGLICFVEFNCIFLFIFVKYFSF